MLLHSLCQHHWLLTDALQMQLQVGIELELLLVKSAVPVCAFVSHLLAYVSFGCTELVIITRQFGSVVISRHWCSIGGWLVFGWHHGAAPDCCKLHIAAAC